MARNKSEENSTDPATGKPLPQGVSCRGPLQYRARKRVDGTRQTRTFETARLAREWLEGTAVQVREGSFVDRRSLDQSTLAKLVQRYVDSQMQVGGRRRGAAEDLGHIPAITGDAIGQLKLSKLTASAVRGFRDRQEEAYSAGTVVKRLNLLASIISYAMAEWDLPLPMNPATAQAVKRPEGADVKRDRILMPPSPTDIRQAAEQGLEAPRHEEERLLEAVAKSEWPDDLLVTKVALAQAMRQGEILNLRWVDVDFDGQLLTIRGRHSLGTKTRKHQKTARRKAEVGWEVRPMMTETADLLREHLGDRDRGPEDLVRKRRQQRLQGSNGQVHQSGWS